MNSALSEEMDRLIEAGDEAGMKRLFVERFSEFDQDEQEEIFVMVFFEALEEQAADIALRPMQEEALEMAMKLRAIRGVALTQEKEGGEQT